MVAEARYLSLSKSGSDIQASVFAASGRHAVIAGASGSGKTAAAKVILDHDLAAGRHVVIADPEGVYGDYGRLVTTTKALLRYLEAVPGKKGVRLAGDKPADLAEILETIFEWAGRETRDGRLPQVTVVVDELTIYLGRFHKDAEVVGRLEHAIGAIANRGRGRGVWGLWVAQEVSQIPDPVLHTSRLALVGQHKDARDWKFAVRLFTGLGDASRIANLRLAEFGVWWPGQADIFTLRPPSRGGYQPIINPSHMNEMEVGDGETDVYALLADTPGRGVCAARAMPAGLRFAGRVNRDRRRYPRPMLAIHRGRTRPPNDPRSSQIMPKAKTRVGRATAWLARVPKRDRDFIRQYGAYAVSQDLQHILGWTAAQVDLARRAFKAMPSQHSVGRKASFSTLFEVYHGRPPDLGDFPPPRYYPARRGWQWTEPEEELLRALHGLEPPEGVAEELSRLLVTVTGDRRARRTRAAVQAHAGHLGLDGRCLHGKRGLLVKDAARLSGIGSHTIGKAIQDGHLSTFGHAKYRFIPWPTWIRWRDRQVAAQERRQKSIAALPETCINAREAQRRLGIGESHLGRLLKGKVLRAWKIDGRWHISARSLAEVRRARERGGFRLETPAFARLRKKANEHHRALRRRQRTEPGHTLKVQTGFLAPVEVGFRAGVSYATVYADIKSSVLVAARQGQTGRERYEVAAADAAAYIAWIKAEPNHHLRRHQRLVRRMHDQGLITKNG